MFGLAVVSSMRSRWYRWVYLISVHLPSNRTKDRDAQVYKSSCFASTLKKSCFSSCRIQAMLTWLIQPIRIRCSTLLSLNMILEHINIFTKQNHINSGYPEIEILRSSSASHFITLLQSTRGLYSDKWQLSLLFYLLDSHAPYSV